MKSLASGGYGASNVGLPSPPTAAQASYLKAKSRAHAAFKSRNLDEALHWFEQAAELRPEDAEILAAIGQCLCLLGRRIEGTQRLRAAGALLRTSMQPASDVSPLLGVIAQLQHWNDFAGALELCEAVALTHSGDHRVHQLLALTHSQLNRTSEALAAARRALELDPENSMMHILHASIEIDAGQPSAAKGHLEDVISYELTDREEYRAHKELARALDKLGQYDQVFQHLYTAEQYADKLPEYRDQDRAAVPTLLAANKLGFDRSVLARWASARFPQQPSPPVFVIGFLRSGTTLAQEVLAAHPDVFVADEANLIQEVQSELQRMAPSASTTAARLAGLDLGGVMHLRDYYWKRVRQRFGDQVGQKMLIDKFTMNTLHLGLINCIFPDAKVIFAVRDPRDVCVSSYMQLMSPSPTTAHLLSWRGTAEIYAAVMDWWLHIRPQLSMAYLELRYEDAVTQFEPTFRKVFDFLGLPWDPQVAKFHERVAGKFISTPSRSQVSQPIYASSVTRWRHFTTEVGDIIDVLQPYIEEFGYEAC